MVVYIIQSDADTWSYLSAVDTTEVGTAIYCLILEKRLKNFVLRATSVVMIHVIQEP